jgi:hypothetical protein
VYQVEPPVPVPAPDAFLRSVVDARLDRGSALAGFDFPIGVPRRYAAIAGISNFLDALPRFGHEEWRDFYRVAERPEEVTPWRPFYPQRPGGTSQRDLTAGLGVASIDELLRACERRTAARRAACSMFWTLGGNQVGKAAISGWRDVLAPAMRDDTLKVAIWPFAGPLDQLLAMPQLVVAETYPAEFYGHLRIALRGSKRRQQVRQDESAAFASWLANNAGRVEFTEGAQRVVESGFGGLSDGEDQFDAFVGLIGMLNIVIGRRSAGDPDPASAEASIEGWILGQHCDVRRMNP